MIEVLDKANDIKSLLLKETTNRLDGILESCESFENQLYCFSSSFVESIKNLKKLDANINEDEIQECFKEFQEEIEIIKNNFETDLEKVLNRFHETKCTCSSNVVDSIELMRKGMSEMLKTQIEIRLFNEINKQSETKTKYFIEKIMSIRSRIINSKEDIKHLQLVHGNNQNKYQQKVKRIVKLVEKEKFEFLNKKYFLEREIEAFKINSQKEKNELLLSGSKNKLDSSKISKKLNNCSNENKELECEIYKSDLYRQRDNIKNQNIKEHKEHINVFRAIHDKICGQMDEINSFTKELYSLRKENEEKEVAARKKYNSEQKQMKLEIEKVQEKRKDFEKNPRKYLNEYDIEYIDCAKQYSDKVLLIQQQQEKEIEILENLIQSKYENKIKEEKEKFDEYDKMNSSYLEFYNELKNKLTEPVFQSAIGLEKSKEYKNLLKIKENTIYKIEIERNNLIADLSNSQLRQEKVEDMKFRSNFNEISLLQKNLKKAQNESKELINKKETEKEAEIDKLKHEVNRVRRLYLTKKIYLFDEIESKENTEMIQKIKDDEFFENQIIKIKISIKEMKKKVENRKNRNIQILEEKLNYVTDEFNRIFNEYKEVKIKHKKQEDLGNHSILNTKNQKGKVLKIKPTQTNYSSPHRAKTQIKRKP